MFDDVHARLAEMAERCSPTATSESAALLEQIAAATRAENRAAAAQLNAIGRLFAYRLSRCSDTEDWAIDTMAAVAAEVGAALRISHGLASSRVHYARAMRERLPKVAEVFTAGDIDYRLFQTVVYRTDLIVDRDALATVDTRLAAGVGRWPSMTHGRLSARVDAIVARTDPDAVRRRRKRGTDRAVWIGTVCDGVAEINGTLRGTDAHALDARLNALAATVCTHDPRTREQRRADALGALAAGIERLGCGCGRADCTAATAKPTSPVVIHVIADQATLDGTSDTPAWEIGAHELITADLLAELARCATVTPLIHPGDAPPEKSYRPSAALAAFVRCRDLTCRWPGCDVPASDCDLDHTIAHAAGGPTHAANLVALCKTHHLVKTFRGWTTKQLPDGTLILTSPAACTYVTTPGSAVLFPHLCRPVADPPVETRPAERPDDRTTDRTAMMPRRTRTRAQQRATRVATERHHNRRARRAHQTHTGGDDEPPPF
jgi:hypothetical protein